MKIYSVLKISVIFIIYILSCEKNSSSFPTITSDDLKHLEIKYLDGRGYSNLMPPKIPDPLGISFRLEFTNLSVSDTVKELYVDNCKVFLITDSLLGTIKIIPWDDINLVPSSTDTITFGKIQESIKIFDPPCGKSIYLTFVIKDRYNNFINFQTDSIYYECDY